MSLNVTARARTNVVLARATFIALLLLAWQGASAAHLINPAVLASPAEVAVAFTALLPTAAFWTGLLATLLNWGTGVLVAFLVAVPLGLALGGIDTLYAAFRIPIEFMRTVPSISLLPVALLLLGSTSQMAILLVCIGATWPLLLQSMYGFHQTEPTLRDVARSYRLNAFDRFTRITLPSAAPFVATGLRIALTIGLLLSVSAEMIGGAPGLGRQLSLAQQSLLVPEMYAYIVVVAGLGTILNLATHGVEGKVLAWHPSQRAA